MMAFSINRRSLLKLVGLGFAVAAFALPLSSARADSEGAGKFVQGLGDKAIATLANKNLSSEQASQIFRDMLHNSFDLDLLGKFALGPNNWRSATPEQKQQYLKLFERLVVQVYSDRFKLYTGEKFKVTSSKSEDDRDTYVTSDILRLDAGAAATQVDWRIRNKGGRYQVIDVIVEGVSMSVTQRSEFSAVIQKNGGDLQEFLDILRERVDKIEN
jgi:phospholipid transport system substrate-binding protein